LLWLQQLGATRACDKDIDDGIALEKDDNKIT
jgi:hypothetical protein